MLYKCLVFHHKLHVFLYWKGSWLLVGAYFKCSLLLHPHKIVYEDYSTLIIVGSFVNER
jgi:hypothetical protein